MLFDASTLHIFYRRDLNTVSASSFIIVVTVGFIGLLMICAGSSTYYRRRLARGHLLYARTVDRVATPTIRPRLWDIALAARSSDESLMSVSGQGWQDIQVGLFSYIRQLTY